MTLAKALIRLKCIDLRGLENIKSIGNGFMYGCEELEYIDLTGLSGVTTKIDMCLPISYFLSFTK